jgi:hypothetical protein
VKPIHKGRCKAKYLDTVRYFLLIFNLMRQWKHLSTGADPGFVVRGGVSRRGVWGGGSGGAKSPPEALGILGIADIYLNDNFEPTTPFLSDQKNLILSLNFVG